MKNRTFWKIFFVADIVVTVLSLVLLANSLIEDYGISTPSFPSFSSIPHIEMPNIKYKKEVNIEKEQFLKGKELKVDLVLSKQIENIIFKTEFEKKIEERLNKEEGIHTVYIKDLKTKDVIEVGPIRKYPPASTFKMYTASLVLKDIQDGKLYWGSSATLSKGIWSAGPGTYFTEEDLGKSYTVESLLWRMIVQSDNTAQSMLFALLGRSNIEKRLVEDLELKETSLENFETSNRDMAFMLERIYNKEFLNENLSNHLMNLMIQGYARDRIKAGVPNGTKVANKGGTLPSSKHDVAIVFSEKQDYLLVIYTDEIIEAKAVQTIKDVSKMTWEYFEKVGE